jgi:hypothetical protein
LRPEASICGVDQRGFELPGPRSCEGGGAVPNLSGALRGPTSCFAWGLVVPLSKVADRVDRGLPVSEPMYRPVPTVTCRDG